MNQLQLVQQFRYRLLAKTWAGGAKVFGQGATARLGSVRIVSTIPENVLDEMRPPCALIVPGDAEPDKDEPGYERASLEVVIVCAADGDPFGERSVIGGPLSGGANSSLGKGVLQLQQIVLDAVKVMGEQDGVTLDCVYKSGLAGARDPNLGWVSTRVLRFEARLTVDPSYPPAPVLTATDGTGGVANVSWTLQADRYDRRTNRLVWKAGASAPATVLDGTEVALGSLLATSAAPVVGAGTRSFALFPVYDETGSGTNEVTGATPAAQSGLVVT